ncbi:MAG: bifunctional DNA-formamidopyrimidine glycosylase/DNA-(apurinic or apyrimidinic site) lyase [Methylococcales bacterium]|nr:bifunctional DNA-formamidopyrimidine glycosylase/DNA-(apurinic or apyrimidinic site) lyase [Methylococcales bacterium]
MPELPEVETSRAGIAPHIEQKCFKSVIVRESRLRWPVPALLETTLAGLCLESVNRRGKYLLLTTSRGTLILHLGMSGNLRITNRQQPAGKHDHVDFVFADDTVLRFNDQRKFGAVLWWPGKIEEHPLLAKLGPEPLSDAFDGNYLQMRAGKRSLPVKCLLMDSHIVVGVGNIYANEALFMAGIHPGRPAGGISPPRYAALVEAVKTVLRQAIDQGGTTLRDFTNAQGKPGYFQQSLNVYGRANQPCPNCEKPLEQIKIAQRASYFCSSCQL